MQVNELTTRIQRVTEDLKAIQEQLGAAQGEISDPEHARILDELLNLELLDEFKAAVDHMRHFLWSYIEAHAQQTGKDLHCLMETLRLQRATEMLRVLNQKEVPGSAQTGNTTFFDMIQKIADATVERHGASDAKSNGKHSKIT